MGTDAGKIGLMKKSMYGTMDAASNWERDWQEHVKKWGFQLGLSSKNLFHHKENRVSGLNRRLHWGKEGIVYQHDPRHIDVLVKDLGL